MSIRCAFGIVDVWIADMNLKLLIAMNRLNVENVVAIR